MHEVRSPLFEQPFVMPHGFDAALAAGKAQFRAPQNMLTYGTETFEARDFVRTGLVLTVIALALVMLPGATYWHWLGYA